MNIKLSYFSTIKFLSKYIMKHKKNFIMFYIGWFVDMILSISIPILFGIMIDQIIYYQNIYTFMNIAFLFFVVSVFCFLLFFLIYAQHSYLMNMFIFDIRNEIFSHYSNCDAMFLSSANSGDIISLIQKYPYECLHFVIRNIVHTINYTLLIIVINIYLFVINWKIGLLVLFVAPISVWINTKFGKTMRKLGEKQRVYNTGYIGRLYENLSCLRDIRMLGAIKRINSEFVSDHRKMFEIKNKTSILKILASKAIELSNLLIMLGIFILTGYLAYKSIITIGLLTVVLAFYDLLVFRISELSSFYIEGQNRLPLIQHIYEFLNTATESNWKGEKCLTVNRGEIRFCNVDFQYQEDNFVLKQFNLDIVAGEKIALVGKSGCGKTTLSYMLIGFYRPQSGYIEIDGQKLNDCSIESIRNNIGIIQQEVLLFDGTIRENIVIGSKTATEDQILQACENAGILEFIDSLPNKFDTKIGANGAGLSGGQKQRLAIARIYLKNPPILVFDEATSALDRETEEQIHDAWEKALIGRTCIVIAHRLSSVLLCERVAIMDNGQLIEIGDPTTMLKNCDYFKTLFAIKEDNADE